MKRFIGFATLLLLTATFSFAQNDPEAKKILDAASTKYKSMNAFEASFTKTLKNKAAGISETDKGTVKVKGEKYHLTLNEDVEVVTNTDKVWTILHEDMEINRDSYDAGEVQSIKPSEIVGMYKSGYRYIHMGQQKVGNTNCSVVDLEPDLPADKREAAQIYKIRMFFNKDNTIKRWVMYEKNGNEFTYTIDSIKTGTTLSDKVFSVDEKEYEKKGYIVIALDE